MASKRKRRLYAKFVILAVLSYFDNTNTKILDIIKKHKTRITNLAELLPQDDAYVYTFSIGNEAGDERAEVDLEYELTLRTTTNLPLSYELYMNQDYTDEGATSIITENVVDYDEQGTYFRTIKTEKQTLPYTEGITN